MSLFRESRSTKVAALIVLLRALEGELAPLPEEDLSSSRSPSEFAKADGIGYLVFDEVAVELHYWNGSTRTAQGAGMKKKKKTI